MNDIQAVSPHQAALAIDLAKKAGLLPELPAGWAWQCRASQEPHRPGELFQVQLMFTPVVA